MSNNKYLLLINSSLPDINFVTNSLEANTQYILYNENDNYDSILNNVTNLNNVFDSIGIMAVNDGLNILSFNDKIPIIKNVFRRDTEMKSWKKCINFLNSLVNFTTTRNIDLITCNIFNNKDWQYIIKYIADNYNIDIQSSTNITGKTGDWILESNNVSLDTTYFTSNIKNYNHSLDKVFESSFVINNNGKLYVSGLNSDGQLGFQINTLLSSFELLPLLLNVGETISKVSGGNNHTVVLTSTGRIFATGRNSSGQLGFNNFGLDVSTFTLVTISGLNNGEIPINIFTGDDHTIVLTNNNRLFATGDNWEGQLGLGQNNNFIDTFTEVTISSLTNGETIQKVFCGDYYTFILTSLNRLFATGENFAGQLGLGDYNIRDIFTEVIINTSTYDPDTDTTTINQMTDTITQIACGNQHSIILTATNKIFSCGYNYNGQLGLNDTNDRNTFTEVNSIQVYDEINSGYTSIPLNEIITKIICGDYYTMFLTSTNKLFATGDNNDGQLGTGDYTNYSIFTEIVITGLNVSENIINIDAGRRHTLLVTNEGRLFGTGDNGDNQLGIETNGNSVLEFTLIPITGLNNGEQIQNVICGEFQSILLTNNNRLFGAGENFDGQLGKQLYETIYGFIEANIPLQQGEKIQQVSAGRYHTFALTSNNRLFGTGTNSNGELGLGNSNTLNRYEFTLIPTTFLSNNETISKIACGQYHTIILTSNNRLFGTGYTWNGQLGTNNTNTIYEFTELSIIGLNNGEIVTNIIHVVMIFSLVSTNLNKVFGTGENWIGQLGTGNNNQSNVFTQSILPNLNTNETISQILAGTYHSLILTNQNRIFVTGNNSDGQLGTGDNNTINTFTSITLPNLNNDELISQISNGWSFSTFLTTNNRIFSTGGNWNGRLGTSNFTSVNVFTPSVIPTLNNNETITQLISGINHTLFLTNNNRIFGTGANFNGELGIGENILTNNNTNTFTLVPTISPFVPVSFGEYIFNNSPPSNICFLKDTPVNTDQGILLIQNINPKIHTIRGKPVILVSKTISDEKYLVCIKQGALGKNIPSQNTTMTMNHELFYNGKMIPAKYLLDMGLNVKRIKYNREILYNILLDSHYKMIVNNLIVETLNPKNPVAKLLININNTNDINLIKKYTEIYNKQYNNCKKLCLI